MAQSLARIYLHLIFSTKNREPFLKDNALREKTHAYLAGICNNLDSPPLLIGGVSDHIHIFCSLSRTQTVSEVVREMKRQSSKWIKTKDTRLSAFHWQKGYGAFSISPSHVAPVRDYIATQEEHHRKETFQDEVRRFLKKYGIEYDERYVWD